jgi:molybdate transport system substrate-binding protein
MNLHMLCLGAIGLAIAAAPVRAGEIKVLSAESPRDALEHVAAQFEKATGHKVVFEFMTAGQVRDRIESGENADIAIASSSFIDALVKSGRATDATRLGRIGLAIAVHEGATAPDISTAEKFTAALRAAKSVSFTDPAAGGTAGLYFASLLEKLGIADEVKKKAVLSKGGRDAAQKVASGAAEIGITFPSEIAPVKGAKVGPMLPPELQNYVVYIAAIGSKAGNAGIAKDFVAALIAQPSRESWIGAGFEPLGGK